MSSDDQECPGGSSLADYLCLKYRFPEKDAPFLAELLGLKRVRSPAPTLDQLMAEAKKYQSNLDDNTVVATGTVGSVDPHLYPHAIPQLRFTRHLDRKPKKTTRGKHQSSSKRTEKNQTKDFKRTDIPSIPLQPWNVLWPFLKRVLSESSQTSSIDFTRLIGDITTNKPLKKIPYRAASQWPQNIVVIADYSRHLTPVYSDFIEIIRRLLEWFPQRITLLLIDDAEQSAVIELSGSSKKEHDEMPVLHEQAAVIVLSDLGVLNARPWSRYTWQERGVQLKHLRQKPLVLMPAHPTDWHRDVTRYFQTVQLDHGCHLQLQSATGQQQTNPEEGLDQLLTALAPMARITPSMLREIRIEHPAGLSISDEIRFWSKAGFGSQQLFKQWLNRDLQRHYIDLLKEDEQLSQLSENLMLKHEKSLPQRLQVQQIQHFMPVKMIELNLSQQHYLQRLTESVTALEPLERKFFKNWMASLEDMKGENPWVSEIEPLYDLYYAQLSVEEKREKVAPESESSSNKLHLELIDGREGLQIMPVQWKSTAKSRQSNYFMEHETISRKWRIATIKGKGAAYLNGYSETGIEERILKRTIDSDASLNLPEALTRLTISTNQQMDTFDLIQCPSWATSIGRDRYGLYTEVTVKDIPFIMRWIPPGEFMMGSPENEPERYGSEGPQHKVKLKQGYWLAETACAQALWQVVTKGNPSRFKGSQDNPAENIDWEMAQEFIKQLNQINPEFKFRLPSEAEWEYACRAGTTTPFSFGSELTTEDANYDGNYPYASGEKGEYREMTMPVKSFKANPWGLYQMHGNVWEWCEDRWHGSYKGSDRPDDGSAWKTGSSEYNVCRGGSWLSNGRDLRSAYRRNVFIANGNFGFRLARGPELQSSQGAGAALRQHERGTSDAASSQRQRKEKS